MQPDVAAELPRTSTLRRIFCANVVVAWHGLKLGGEPGEDNRKVWLARSTDDGRVATLPRPGVGGAIDPSALLKRPAEAGLHALAAGWDRWQAAGRSTEALLFSARDEPWLGRCRELKLGSQTLIVAAVSSRTDFALGTWRDAAALGR